MASRVVTTTTTAAALMPSPLTIQILANQHLGGVTGFFPFNDLDAISSIDNQGLFQKLPIIPSIDGQLHINLFPDGCRLDDGKADCQKACQIPRFIFGSLDTFYNCAALSSLVYWTRSFHTFYIPDEADVNASALMAGVALSDFDAKPTLASFVTCAEAACAGDGLHRPCSNAVTALSPKSPPLVVLEAMSSFCPQLPVEINPDIFGPGVRKPLICTPLTFSGGHVLMRRVVQVLISYVLQVCFASVLFLSLKLFVIWVHFVENRRPKQHGKPFSRFNLTRRLTWHDSSALSRTSIAIASTLVEFQEAQCWFVFAIQIASILAVVVSAQGGTFWGEIIVNAAVAFHVSQNGILSMFLIQICLHRERIHNWHTFVGFFAEYILAIIATSQTIYFRDAFELFRKQKQIAACGDNPSPRSYCSSMRGIDGFNLTFFPRPFVYKIVFLVLDSLAILILLVDQLAWTLRANRRTRNLRFFGHPLGHGPLGKYKAGWKWLRRWAFRMLELAYFVINILYMISLVKVFSTNSFEAKQWSYGQIIAMTVWGPVIVKLFDLVISGPPRNGSTLNSGPPRLRIDNFINSRLDQSEGNQSEAGTCSPPLRGAQPGRPNSDVEQTADGSKGEGQRTSANRVASN
ncbi:hypothetical protein CDD80_7533 [Ophiocordyceps camponoti-rufipedis]|uniref:Uncharacterized protein n=1 Tax=Ophiocordyceps camponoti-rufipedis TaxID=2004952 RepID=A0A2C5ZE18_9HYPO|nr:hypothetical protein CDD80_7533 [Ophiocordyceps camponoti-rufipedis]